MKYINILFIVFITIISCNNKQQTIIFDGKFPINKELKGTPLKKVKQLSPFRISIMDNLLMVNDWDENPRIHFYNKDTYEEVAKYGYIGKGPFDFNDPECSYSFYNVNDSKKFLIYELGSGLIYEISLDSILRASNNVLSLNENAILRKRFLPPNLVGSDHIKKIGNFLVGEAIPDKKIKYFKLDFENFNKINKYGTIYKSTFLDKVPPAYKQYIDRSYLSYSKHNKKYIASYFLLNRIQIMDNDFNLIKQINYGKEKIPNNINPFSNLNVNYFGFSFSGNYNFYVMYNGKNSKGLKERLEPREIHVFDYNGSPIAKYLLDNDILNFTVDEENDNLYIITNNEETPIFKYNLNDK